MIVPETQEHRQAITRQLREATGLDEATLERLIRTFYATARTDPLIGSMFDGVHDWEQHIATITQFWSSVALMTGTYHGQPMGKHVKLPLQPQHFARWLMLFEQAARVICTQQGADLLIEKSRRIAQSLQLGVDTHRGELPPPLRMTDLLQVLAKQPIIADTMEDGLDALAARLSHGLSRPALAQMVQDAVAAGLCPDPVRLPPGALQCHWHLELSPKGHSVTWPKSAQDDQPA